MTKKKGQQNNGKVKNGKEERIVTEDFTEKQKLFCEFYASSKEFFANGTQAYIEAYDIDLSKANAYKGATASAARMLANVSILAYIDSLLELRGLNDPFVDKQLEFLITQNADFKSKLGAIKEYNALKTRIKQKIEHSGGIGITDGFYDEDDELINKIDSGLKSNLRKRIKKEK